MVGTRGTSEQTKKEGSGGGKGRGRQSMRRGSADIGEKHDLENATPSSAGVMRGVDKAQISGTSKDLQGEAKGTGKVLPVKRGAIARDENDVSGAAAPETSTLETRRLQVEEELRKVEQQIYDLETTYLETSSPYGNAVRGYQGFLGGLSQANRKIQIKPEERIFSFSSSTAPVY